MTSKQPMILLLINMTPPTLPHIHTLPSHWKIDELSLPDYHYDSLKNKISQNTVIVLLGSQNQANAILQLGHCLYHDPRQPQFLLINQDLDNQTLIKMINQCHPCALLNQNHSQEDFRGAIEKVLPSYLNLEQWNTHKTETLPPYWEEIFDHYPHPLCRVDLQLSLLKRNIAFNKMNLAPLWEQIKAHLLPPHHLYNQTISWNSQNTEKTNLTEVPSDFFYLSIYPTKGFTNNIQKNHLLIEFTPQDTLSLHQKIKRAPFVWHDKDCISASIAHELNNPLGAIISFLNFLAKDLDIGDAHQKDILSMQTNTTQCKKIIEDILAPLSQRID